jgi:hypothetical protein
MFNVNTNVNAANGLFADNGSGPDKLGAPTATLVSFGGLDLGGTYNDHPAGTSVALAGGSLRVNANGSWSLTGAPLVPGQYQFRYKLANRSGDSAAVVTLVIQAAPSAKDDAFVARIGEVTDLPPQTLFADNGSGADNLGFPVATIVSFGGGTLGGSVTDNAAGATVPFVGGTLQIRPGGALVVSNPTTSGTYTLTYRLQNAVDYSDASITIRVAKAPVAKDDLYTFNDNVAQNTSAGAGLFADHGNGADELGIPDAVLTSFGGGSLGGNVAKHLPGSAVDFAGGTLTVNSNGSWSLVDPPFVAGSYAFFYRLTNEGGTSDAQVTFNIQGPPEAKDDQLNVVVGQTVALPNGKLFADNGSGEDLFGYPAATLTSFGGGSLPGTVTTNSAGATVAFAGGSLTVNGVGSLTIANTTMPGSYTFEYRLSNARGSSDATVTVLVAEPPQAEPDAMTFDFDVEQNVAAGAGLLADNGSGQDFLGTPTAVLTSFGGGSLGGTVTTHAAGDSVTLAGGTLTVKSNGSWTLTGAPFTPGAYTFSYRLTNEGGTSDAVVTLTIEAPPGAQNDALSAVAEKVTVFPPGTLFNDHGNGPDELGFPVAILASFGGGSLGGTVADNTAGKTVPLAGGTLVVNTVGSFTVNNPTEVGEFTFQYRIENAKGSSEATVTLTILEAPIKVDLYLPVVLMDVEVVRP